MRKLLVLSLMLVASVIAIPSVEAKTTAVTAAAGPQIRVQIGGRQRNRRVRTVTRTRIVRTRYGTFREVYRITYLPNGRTQTTVISRTRIRR
jgi:microcystin degradation protein MlrC